MAWRQRGHYDVGETGSTGCEGYEVFRLWRERKNVNANDNNKRIEMELKIAA